MSGGAGESGSAAPQLRDLLGLAAAHAAAGRLDEAAAAYRRILEVRPDNPAALHRLGLVRYRRRDPEAAESLIRRAIAVRPDFPAAWSDLAIVLNDRGRAAEAIDCCRRAIALEPGHAGAFGNLGLLLRNAGRIEDAVACQQRAIALRPEAPEAHNNLGVALCDLGRLDAAAAAFRRAIAIAPGTAAFHTNLAHALLLKGELEEGWRENEWRPKRRFAQPQWDGSRLDGRTILLHAEQGFGDTIQFVRYVPLVKQRGGRVVLEVQPELDRLCRSVGGHDEYRLRGQALPPFDLHASLLTLPHIFRTTLETIPGRTPYLEVDAPCPIRFPRDGRLRVGLVWAGDAAFPEDRQRSPRLDAFLPLLEVPGVQFYGLQKGDGRADLAGRTLPPCFTDCGAAIGDFADTAAIMKELDLVISSSTAAAHLAGALARPLWLVLSVTPGFRWLLGRSDTPWYPTARLFRQSERGDWRPVMQAVAEALRERAARGR
ncbi:MAG: tetratricopeptide repeat protein [Dongiaceae bacterium]